MKRLFFKALIKSFTFAVFQGILHLRFIVALYTLHIVKTVRVTLNIPLTLKFCGALLLKKKTAIKNFHQMFYKVWVMRSRRQIKR